MLTSLSILYLFLGGTGAGLLVTLCLMELDRLRLRSSFELPAEVLKYAWIVCIVALVTGGLCLILDMGRPDRLLQLFTSPAITPSGIGAMTLTASGAVALALAVPAIFDGFRLPQWATVLLSLLGTASGLVTLSYTGMLLQCFASIAFWQSFWLPLVFATSSLSCGLGCLFMVVVFVETRYPYVASVKKLSWLDGALILLELGCMAGLLIAGLTKEAAFASAWALVWGDLALEFWGCFVLLGLVCPFVLERFITHGNRVIQLIWAGSTILFGGLALRWCVAQTSLYDITQTIGALGGM